MTNPPDLWLPLRRRSRSSDLALTGATRLWLRQLPPRRRPLGLCQRHPHVANRLAWCWRDDQLIHSVLQDLFEDRRGGRAGFSPVVVRELQRLRDFRLPAGSPALGPPTAS
ncbi:MAG: hypothetical protein LH480_12375 [Rubrivivax sp.]|nr:hypothetical protein [Rubrivivax sp.]